jgi:uncharacterized protein involved in response to NO
VPNRGLWRAPHLPLFLLASLWAALVPLVWFAPGLVCDPVAWHRQELLLGVTGAAMGGYLLTALPHWLGPVGRERSDCLIRPRVTQALVLAWVVGRLLGGSCLVDAPALAGLCLYPTGLTVALVLPVIRARVWGRLPMALAPLLLVLSTVRLRLAADGLTAALGMALLVALVGGRIIPAFLRARAGGNTTSRLRPAQWTRAADLTLALALAAHLAGLGPHWVGTLLLLAALGQTLRMADWHLAKGLHGQQADLALLVIAWLWLPAGFALTGTALQPETGLSLPTAQHALTMGLIGSMVLAVMARAWMRRVPDALRLGPPLAFALLQLATVLRLTLIDPVPATLCWSASWTLASFAATTALFRPVPRPILSARRA